MDRSTRLLAHSGELTQKKYREALLAHADTARQSRELVRVRTDVPVTLDMEHLRHRGAQRERCFDLFSRLGFRTLVTEFAPTAANVDTRYQTVSSRDQLDALAAALRAAGRLRLPRHRRSRGRSSDARALGIAFSIEARRASWVPLASTASAAVEEVRSPSEAAAGPGGNPGNTDVSGAPGFGTGKPVRLSRRPRAGLVPQGPQAIADGVGWPHLVIRDVMGPLLIDQAIAKAGHDIRRPRPRCLADSVCVSRP